MATTAATTLASGTGVERGHSPLPFLCLMAFGDALG